MDAESRIIELAREVLESWITGQIAVGVAAARKERDAAINRAEHAEASLATERKCHIEALEEIKGLRARVGELESERDEFKAGWEKARDAGIDAETALAAARAEISRMRPLVDFSCDTIDHGGMTPEIWAEWERRVNTYRATAPATDAEPATLPYEWRTIIDFAIHTKTPTLFRTSDGRKMGSVWEHNGTYQALNSSSVKLGEFLTEDQARAHLVAMLFPDEPAPEPKPERREDIEREMAEWKTVADAQRTIRRLIAERNALGRQIMAEQMTPKPRAVRYERPVCANCIYDDEVHSARCVDCRCSSNGWPEFTPKPAPEPKPEQGCEGEPGTTLQWFKSIPTLFDGAWLGVQGGLVVAMVYEGTDKTGRKVWSYECEIEDGTRGNVDAAKVAVALLLNHAAQEAQLRDGSSPNNDPQPAPSPPPARDEGLRKRLERLATRWDTGEPPGYASACAQDLRAALAADKHGGAS